MPRVPALLLFLPEREESSSSFEMWLFLKPEGIIKSPSSFWRHGMPRGPFQFLLIPLVSGPRRCFPSHSRREGIDFSYLATNRTDHQRQNGNKIRERRRFGHLFGVHLFRGDSLLSILICCVPVLPFMLAGPLILHQDPTEMHQQNLHTRSPRHLSSFYFFALFRCSGQNPRIFPHVFFHIRFFPPLGLFSILKFFW